ncbi:sensor histidine kinase [Caballeronia insecticola]|uniref:sensor histidine kinase n=1 Tax=Caballeronia insecticola TaxID=758793 RepID=UPI0005C555A1|nr:HWE histidine kinase domain-containing protein [Caballeronia insecticola]
MTAIDAVPPPDLYITAELHRRVPKVVDHLGEKLALQDVVGQMLDHPEQVLPRFVERAMQMTGAASAGISAFEPQEGTPGIFRWRDLRGELACFEGATTPRNHSPCGVCLDRFEPTLTRHPERHYAWIAEAGVVCPEVLLVPLYVAHGQPLGTLWIVAQEERHFDSGHARIMQELASFVGIALAVLQNQQRLQEALAQQEMLTCEMNHRVNNVFSVVDAMIHVGKRSASSTPEFAQTLSGRLHALAAAHALVLHHADPATGATQPCATTLHALTDAIFRPYGAMAEKRVIVAGEDVELGDRATTSLALVFHELATNAVKYGALSADAGQVSVDWERRDDNLFIRWRETGGPAITESPRPHGFGSTLLRNTIARHFGGTLAQDWREQGLQIEFALPLNKLAR